MSFLVLYKNFEKYELKNRKKYMCKCITILSGITLQNLNTNKFSIYIDTFPFQEKFLKATSNLLSTFVHFFFLLDFQVKYNLLSLFNRVCQTGDLFS